MTDDADDTASGLADELLAELDGEGDDSERTGSDALGTDADNGPVSGTFVVTHADEESAVLRDAETAQVHTLSENPDLDAETVVEAEIAPEPPMGVTYEITDLHERREVEITSVGESPTVQATEIAEDQPVGEVTRRERAGEGEIHVVTVPDEQTEAAVEDVLADRETRLAQAALVGASLVEVRSAPGVVEVRYLP